MGEIARKRRSRDLWISRSHLGAAVAGGTIALFISFILGTAVGRAAERGVDAEIETAPDEAVLVDLLARIESSGLRGRGAERLTYPETLGSEQVDVTVPAGVAPPGLSVAQAPVFAELPTIGAPPAFGFGGRVLRTTDGAAASEVAEALVAAGLPVWALVERSGGVAVYEVGAGPFDEETEGRIAMAGRDAVDWVDFSER